jgi:hypothetical protein
VKCVQESGGHSSHRPRPSKRRNTRPDAPGSPARSGAQGRTRYATHDVPDDIPTYNPHSAYAPGTSPTANNAVPLPRSSARWGWSWWAAWSRWRCRVGRNSVRVWYESLRWRAGTRSFHTRTRSGHRHPPRGRGRVRIYPRCHVGRYRSRNLSPSTTRQPASLVRYRTGEPGRAAQHP